MVHDTGAPRWLDGSTWLFVVLVVLTLVPSGCVLWFMSEAMAADAGSAQQRVQEAYRGQLRLVRSRLDGVWRTYAARLTVSGDPAQQFAGLVVSGAADGAVILATDGTPAYPDAGPPDDARATELERRIGALAALPAPSREAAVAAAAERVNDYRTPLSARARLALMDRLRALAPNVWLPTQAALRLSMDLLARERPSAAPDVVRQTGLHDIWALTSGDGHVIGLYRTGRIEAMMHDFLHEISPAGVVFIAFPPDERADANAIAAGPWLPGWQLTFVPVKKSPVDEAVRRRRTMYLSVAVIGIGLITIVGGVAGGGLRRHLRLARLKTDLVAAASHELRTPVASIQVLVEGLRADDPLDPVKTREYLDLVAQENSRLSRRIESFLTFARLDRRRHPFVLAPTPPARIVCAAVDDVRQRLPAGSDLQVDVEDRVPLVRADAEALVTALVNLLDNALKYTAADARIGIRVRADGRFVSFAVTDNGVGIASHEQRRIFRRFYQVDQRLSRETGGVGLGLSIVALIVRGHRGRLAVTSAPGQGSTFTMRIPAAREGRGE